MSLTSAVPTSIRQLLLEHAAGRGTAAAAGLLDRTAEALQRALEVLRGAAGGTDGAP